MNLDSILIVVVVLQIPMIGIRSVIGLLLVVCFVHVHTVVVDV